jgi:NAD(P)-dependent dehydrogenase (short-subunit alcohol dehydrogenase family)
MPAPSLTASSLLPAPTVLVTGAAKRLGREIALVLAANGWRVAVHYRDSLNDAIKTVADCAQLTRGAAAFRANLGNETAVRNLLPTVIAELGRVDVVINGASTFEHDTATSFSFAAMEKHMRANAGAACLLSQALHSHVSARPRATEAQLPAVGVVVNLLDQKLWNQSPDYFSYTLSKAALECATNMLALSLSPTLRVVGVAHGLTLSDPLPGSAPLSSPHDVAAAVLLALQDPSLHGTTLQVGSGSAKNG